MNNLETLQLWYFLSWVAMASAPLCAVFLFCILSYISKIYEVAIIMKERERHPFQPALTAKPVASREEIEAEIISRAESLAKEEVRKILALEKQNRETVAAVAAQRPAPAPRQNVTQPVGQVANAPRPTQPRPPVPPKP